MVFTRKVAALPALALALVFGSGHAQATMYQLRAFVSGLKAPAQQPPEIPTPPSGPSLVGDGVSKAGACATGALGCATWSLSESKNVSVSGENLIVALTGGTTAEAVGSIIKTDGKWYWELTIAPASTGVSIAAGVMEGSYAPTGNWVTDTLATWVKFAEMRNCSASVGGGAYMGGTWNTIAGDVLGYALDMPNRTLTIYKNGTLLGVLCSNLPAAVKPFSSYGSGVQTTLLLEANFGQAPFKHPVPVGYNAGLW